MTPFRFAALLGLGLFAAAPAFAQPQGSPNLQDTLAGKLRAGTLRCDVGPGVSFVFGSTRSVTCVYTPLRGAAQRYTGEIKRYGVDLGFTNSAVMLWSVLASDNAPSSAGMLAGTYGGVAAGATVGVGVDANILTGGNRNGLSLQPLSVEGNIGLNIAAGVAELTLSPAS